MFEFKNEHKNSCHRKKRLVLLANNNIIILWKVLSLIE